MSVTSQTAKLDERGALLNAWDLKLALLNSQKDLSAGYNPRHKILFNKGRYFETSLPKQLLEEVSQLTGITISYNTMIVAGWSMMEDFIIAMNILGWYVDIDLDWI